MKKYLNKPTLIGAGIIAALLILFLIYRDYRPEIALLLNPTHHNQQILLKLIRSHGAWDMLLLLILIAIFNAIPGMSNSVVCIFAGLCYGPAVGFLINWCGNILGNCAVKNLIAKIDLSKRAKKSKLLGYLLNQKHPLIGLTIGYMIPIIPSVLVNFACTRLKVSRKQFLPMVAIGMAPTSFIYAFGGDAIFKGDSKRIIAAVIAIVIVLLCYFLVKKMIKSNRTKRQAA